MTAEQAMSEAERIIGDEANSSPEFMRELYKAFQETPKYFQSGCVVQRYILNKSYETPGQASKFT